MSFEGEDGALPENSRFESDDPEYQKFVDEEFFVLPSDLPEPTLIGGQTSLLETQTINADQTLSGKEVSKEEQATSQSSICSTQQTTPRSSMTIELPANAKIIDSNSVKLIQTSAVSIKSKEQPNVLDDYPSKQEDDERLSLCRDMGSGIIEVSDSDEESRQHSSRAVAAEQNIPGVPASIKQNKHPLMNPDLMQKLQKRYAARALGQSIPVGAGSIFKGTRPNPIQQSDEPSNEALDDDEEDEYAWMKINDEVNMDPDPARTFANLKSCYVRNKRAGLVTFEEEVEFLKAEITENARVRRQKVDLGQSREALSGYPEDLDEDHESDGELFVSQEPKLPRKRAHVAVEGENNLDDVEIVDDESDPIQRSQPMTKRRHTNEKKAEERISMLVGIEDYLAKEKKKEEKKKEAAKKTRGSRKNHKASLKGRKEPKHADKSAKKKPPANKPAAKKPKPGQVDYLNDLDSIFGGNVYEDGNRNLDRPDLALVTETSKDKALKALLAGVPLEDRREARGRKADILRSSKVLGKGKVSADGNGNWNFKGMKSHLCHHQVQGAAWMRERETQDVRPLGGLQADSMGLGKTVMMIASMIANPPADHDSKCTLIVCTSALLTQWRAEITKHTEQDVFKTIICYQADQAIKTFGHNCESTIAFADIVITTYQEVLRSYPKDKPPADNIGAVAREEWWSKVYEEKRGLLHRIHFYRVVLDEAQAIKNHNSQTSKACRGLMSKHRWALSGTPVQNSVNELYPYFKFLRISHTGSLEKFKETFGGIDEDSRGRLLSMLKQFMIRRTIKDQLFGSPIVKLPRIDEKTHFIEFNVVERVIYEAVKNRYIEQINHESRAGTLEKSQRNVLTMLLRLRQLTAHPFMLQETIESLFQIEDVEKIYKKTMGEVDAEDNKAKNMLATMRKMIAEKKNPTEAEPTNEHTPADNPAEEEADQSAPLVFKFRKYLRSLADSSKWSDLKERSLCHKCQCPADDPWVTDCEHIYCKECLNVLAYEAAAKDQNEVACLVCGHFYAECSPCGGIAELEMSDGLTSISQSRGKRKDPDEDVKWINLGGRILPSSKTAAVQAQLEKWFKDDPEKKIIIFSQFHMMMKILGLTCKEQNWNFCTYNGNMSIGERDKAIKSFNDDPNVKVMIASLKCGGIGLNLTMASRVICVDLWWNSSVEQQAFCRVYRIGQESETFITRFVVKNTVDEKLQEMQNVKCETIGATIDDRKMLDQLTLTELMRLFGTVTVDEDEKALIIVEDDDEYDRLAPHNIDNPDHPPRRPASANSNSVISV